MGFGDDAAKARQEARDRENAAIERQNKATALQEAKDKIAASVEQDTGNFANNEMKRQDKVLDDGDGDDDTVMKFGKKGPKNVTDMSGAMQTFGSKVKKTVVNGKKKKKKIEENSVL